MAGNVGHTILWNLIWSPFWRTVHAVLVQQVVEIGHQEKLGKIPAEIIVENVVMQRVCKKLGFHVYREPQHGRVSAELSLSEQAAKWAGSR